VPLARAASFIDMSHGVEDKTMGAPSSKVVCWIVSDAVHVCEVAVATVQCYLILKLS